MISILSDFNSVYQIRKRLGWTINGSPVGMNTRQAEDETRVVIGQGNTQ
jgi:hypothetical protein